MKKEAREILEAMAKATTGLEWLEITCKIDYAFQHEKITWQDNELLYALARRLWK